MKNNTYYHTIQGKLIKYFFVKLIYLLDFTSFFSLNFYFKILLSFFTDFSQKYHSSSQCISICSKGWSRIWNNFEWFSSIGIIVRNWNRKVATWLFLSYPIQFIGNKRRFGRNFTGFWQNIYAWKTSLHSRNYLPLPVLLVSKY